MSGCAARTNKAPTEEFDPAGLGLARIGCRIDQHQRGGLTIGSRRVGPRECSAQAVAGDPRQGDRVAILGPTLQREVFQGENPLGKSIRIGDARFRVIGVMASKGESMGFNMDDVAIIPVATGLRLFNQSGLFRIMVQARGLAAWESEYSRIVRYVN